MTDKPKKKTVADYPELVAQWHPTKNGELRPGDVTAGSHKKVWWACPEGPDHHWQSHPRNRTALGRKCPYCACQKPSVTNSLAGLFPQLSTELHPTRNQGVRPENIVAGSGKKYWWQCQKSIEHIYLMDVWSRTARNKGCRECRSVAYLFPDLAQQWHATKNRGFSPKNAFPTSKTEVWWQCEDDSDHAWKARINSRTRSRTGCPLCASLHHQYPKIASEWHPTKNGEMKPTDVTPGSTKRVWWRCSTSQDHEWQANVGTRQHSGCPICAGYKVDGSNNLNRLAPEIASEWHPTKNGGLLPANIYWRSGKKVWWRCGKDPTHEWQAKISSRVHGGEPCRLCRSIVVTHPSIAAEWHPKLNLPTKVEDISAGSSRKHWWRCEKGADHIWETTVVSRTNQQTGCPYCRGLKASTTNSLASTYPNIAKEWHPTKNGATKPDKVVAGSGKTYWWKCPKGPDHEWQTPARNRTTRSTLCPFCCGQKLSVTNSLTTKFPAIAAEWHPTKNGKLNPGQIGVGSKKKAWWRCSNEPNHEWAASIGNRTRLGRGCPYCARQKLLPERSLANVSPSVSSEWHPTKNGGVTPRDIAAKSGRKYWWKCPNGPDHEWIATPNARVGRGTNCPACEGLKVSTSNSLATLYPLIAAEWHPTKNGLITPAEVVSGSEKKYWWKCPNGPDHEWQAHPGNRTSLGRGCPACAGKQVSITNSLSTQFPAVAAEWHPHKNGSLIPSKVVAGTQKKVWWQCSANNEHEWSANITSRTAQNTGCPYCNIAPRSRQEIRLSFELAYHIPIDQEFHKIKTARRLWDVDICAPDLKLIIEFDGAYFHAKKAEKDRTKAQNLRRNGWRVVRVREAPLKKLSKWNVVIPTNADAHEAALLVLEHLQSVLDMDIPRMDERQAAEGPLCAKEAEAYIEKLLAEKQAAEAQ